VPTKAERTALFFLSAVVLAGGAVRLARASKSGLRPAPAAEAALDRQRRVTDSMARVPRAEPGRQKRTIRPQKTDALRVKTPVVIDVDRASAKELEALPRIGPALAQRIVDEREAHGIFGSIEALDKRVRGIGPAMAAALQPLVTFSGR
jgi:competence protein ComEA